ncbi:MAG: hypothetical protein AVDCRST_MAG59-1011, partial [uncultured Thermomicrobiales bacterium]
EPTCSSRDHRRPLRRPRRSRGRPRPGSHPGRDGCRRPRSPPRRAGLRRLLRGVGRAQSAVAALLPRRNRPDLRRDRRPLRLRPGGSGLVPRRRRSGVEHDAALHRPGRSGALPAAAGGKLLDDRAAALLRSRRGRAPRLRRGVGRRRTDRPRRDTRRPADRRSGGLPGAHPVLFRHLPRGERLRGPGRDHRRLRRRRLLDHPGTAPARSALVDLRQRGARLRGRLPGHLRVDGGAARDHRV